MSILVIAEHDNVNLVAATHQSPSATFNPIPAQGNRLQYVLNCTHKP